MSFGKVPELYKPLFNNDDWKYAYIRGGRWGLKTYTVARYCLQQIAKYKGHIIVARQFQNSIRDSCYSVLVSIISTLPAKIKKIFKVNKTSIQSKRTGATISFFGIQKNVDSIRSFNNARIIWIDESNDVLEESFNIIEPTIRYPNSKYIYTWNPHRKTDAVEIRRANRSKSDLDLFINYCDVEPHYITDEFWTAYRNIERQSPTMLRHIYYGEFLPDSSYNPFSSAKFLSEPLPVLHSQLFAGVDLAWTENEHSDYTSVVVGDAAGNVQKCIAFRESDNKKRLEKIYEQVKDCFRTFIDVTGGAGVGTAKELREKGVPNVTGISYTTKKKNEHLENLIYRCYNDKLTLIGQDEILEEMRWYERSPDGLKSGAISGKHDDRISALMLYAQLLKVQYGN